MSNRNNPDDRRILVVDDEEDICEILRFNLESEGFGVVTAHSADEALDAMGAGTAFDLLLLDVMMERTSGFELARQLRADGNSTPIIFLTARDTHDDQLQGFTVGADDYITKPFAFDTVLARIRAVLRRTAPQPADPTPLPDNLTKREYLIYRLLADNAGRFLTREEILAAVWPDDALVGERSVDVHIARLRKKMGADGNRIVNRTGFGYGLV